MSSCVILPVQVNGAKNSRPSRPPQPYLPRSTPSSPRTQLYSPSVMNNSMPSIEHTYASDHSDEEIYGQRPKGAPSSAVPVLPILPIATPRRLTPRPQQTSPLVNGRLSPHVAPAENGSSANYAVPHKPRQERAGATPSPTTKPVPSPRKSLSRNSLKRSPSKVKLKVAKKHSQAALATVTTTSGYKLRNIKVRQHAAENHPAMKHYEAQKRKGPTLLELAMSAPPPSKTESL